MLDLILTNSISAQVNLHSDSVVPIDRYHPPLNLTYTLLSNGIFPTLGSLHL